MIQTGGVTGPHGDDDAPTVEKTAVDEGDAPADDEAAEQPTHPYNLPATAADPWAGVDSIVPIVGFVVLNRIWGLTAGIVGATVWGVFAAIRRRRNDLPIGKFLPLVVAFIVARGVAGIVTDSEDVYFGIGIGLKVAIGIALIGSAVIGRNLVGIAAPYVIGFDEATRAHSIYRSVTAHLSVVTGVWYLVSSGYETWLLANSTANEFVIIRTLINWPAGMILFVGGLIYAEVRMRRIEDFPGLMTLFERQIEAQTEAIENRRRRRSSGAGA